MTFVVFRAAVMSSDATIYAAAIVWGIMVLPELASAVWLITRTVTDVPLVDEENEITEMPLLEESMPIAHIKDEHHHEREIVEHYPRVPGQSRTG